MKNLISLTSFILFTANISLATNTINPNAIGDFSGHWVATTGQVTSTIGIKSDCTRVEITIEQTTDRLVTTSYKSDCGLYGSHWGPVTEDLKDGKVFEAGTEVGSIDSTTLKTTSVDSGVTYLYSLQLINNTDGSPALKTIYGVQNFTGTVTTEAVLKKQ